MSLSHLYLKQAWEGEVTRWVKLPPVTSCIQWNSILKGNEIRDTEPGLMHTRYPLCYLSSRPSRANIVRLWRVKQSKLTGNFRKTGWDRVATLLDKEQGWCPEKVVVKMTGRC